MQFAWLLAIILNILGFSGSMAWGENPSAIPDVITYANDRVLKNARGELFYHDGTPMLVGGNIKYPKWADGRFFKERGTFYFPDGSSLFEPSPYFYYPAGQTGGRHVLYNGYSWTYPNGSELVSQIWSAAGLKHPDGQIAFDGKNLFAAGNPGVPTDHVELYTAIGKFGYVHIPMTKSGNRVDFRFTMALNPFHLSYIHPLVFTAQNGLPTIGRELTIKLAIQTGYFGELLVATVAPDKTSFEFFKEPAHPIPPFPFPQPQPPPFPPFPFPPGTGDGNVNPMCGHFLLEGNHIPDFMATDPIGFTRQHSR